MLWGDRRLGGLQTELWSLSPLACSFGFSSAVGERHRWLLVQGVHGVTLEFLAHHSYQRAPGCAVYAGIHSAASINSWTQSPLKALEDFLLSSVSFGSDPNCPLCWHSLQRGQRLTGTWRPGSFLTPHFLQGGLSHVSRGRGCRRKDTPAGLCGLPRHNSRQSKNSHVDSFFLFRPFYLKGI